MKNLFIALCLLTVFFYCSLDFISFGGFITATGIKLIENIINSQDACWDLIAALSPILGSLLAALSAWHNKKVAGITFCFLAYSSCFHVYWMVKVSDKSYHLSNVVDVGFVLTLLTILFSFFVLAMMKLSENAEGQSDIQNVNNKPQRAPQSFKEMQRNAPCKKRILTGVTVIFLTSIIPSFLSVFGLHISVDYVYTLYFCETIGILNMVLGIYYSIEKKLFDKKVLRLYLYVGIATLIWRCVTIYSTIFMFPPINPFISSAVWMIISVAAVLVCVQLKGAFSDDKKRIGAEMLMYAYAIDIFQSLLWLGFRVQGIYSPDSPNRQSIYTTLVYLDLAVCLAIFILMFMGWSRLFEGIDEKKERIFTNN